MKNTLRNYGKYFAIGALLGLCVLFLPSFFPRAEQEVISNWSVVVAVILVLFYGARLIRSGIEEHLAEKRTKLDGEPNIKSTLEKEGTRLSILVSVMNYSAIIIALVSAAIYIREYI